MQVKKVEPSFVDDRGQITDVLSSEVVDYATIISTTKGAIRGNHYHKLTFQWLYVISGSLLVRVQEPGRDIEEAIIKTGDLLRNNPLERHAFKALENTTMLVLTRGPRGGDNYETDTYRLTTNLISN